MPIDADLAGLANMQKSVYDPDEDNKIAAANIAADLTNANLANVTRYKWLGAPHEYTGGAESFGIALDPDADEHATYSFAVKDLLGFVSLTSIKVVYAANVTANEVVLDLFVYYAAPEQAQNTHTDSDLTNVITITGTLRQAFLTSLTLSSLDITDIVIIQVNRDANNASDDNTGDLIINGLLIEYEANM